VVFGRRMRLALTANAAAFVAALSRICRTIKSGAHLVENQRRRSPRYSFAGTAEITADNSNASATATVSELSLRGCRLDLKNPFPLSTPITVKIRAGGELFQSKGRIIYQQPGISAGVTFLTIEPQSRAVLRRWLDAAGKGTQLPSA
jgi:PilZ domain